MNECFSEIIFKYKLHDFRDNFHRDRLELCQARLGQ